jgi:hypothetical protein
VKVERGQKKWKEEREDEKEEKEVNHEEKRQTKRVMFKRTVRFAA